MFSDSGCRLDNRWKQHIYMYIMENKDIYNMLIMLQPRQPYKPIQPMLFSNQLKRSSSTHVL